VAVVAAAVAVVVVASAVAAVTIAIDPIGGPSALQLGSKPYN
jgi:hypothetical protein